MQASTLTHAPPTAPRRGVPARLGRIAAGLAAGIVTQVACYYFWAAFGQAAVGPLVLPLGRTPDEVLAVLLPALSGFIAATYDPRGWWWQGQLMAFPALMVAHVLFAAGVEITYGRAPTLGEEWRFLTVEGHRLIAGFIGSYFGALLQRE